MLCYQAVSLIVSESSLFLIMVYGGSVGSTGCVCNLTQFFVSDVFVLQSSSSSLSFSFDF